METFFPLAAILNVFCHVLLYGLESRARFPNACTKENNNKKMQQYQQWAAMPAAQSHTSGPMLQNAGDFMQRNTQTTSVCMDTLNRSLKEKALLDFLQNYPDGELSLKGHGYKLCWR